MEATNKEDVHFDISPLLLVYKDGRVYRIVNCLYAPPSPKDSSTSVSSKDVTISPYISARIYLPKLAAADPKLPVLVWFHGGSFCAGSALSFYSHHYLNIMSSEAKAVSVSIENWLAPENSQPATYEDCWEGLQWVASHTHVEKIEVKEPWLVNHYNFDKIFIDIGESANGNIVHNTLMRAGKVGDCRIGFSNLIPP